MVAPPAHASTPDLVPVRRALLSVSDKTGLAGFAAALAREFGVELVSTGGTSATLRAAGLDVRDVSELTGFPEIMGGRVKTLHPRVHGGILALRDAHAAELAEHDVAPIDLVVVNLYPFEQTVTREGVTHAEAIENVDVGGPAMTRAAAKNHAWVAAVTDPAQYADVLAALRANKGSTPYAMRQKLAAAAFARTAAYDAAIAAHLARATDDEPGALPPTFALALPRAASLRYGENPHQPAALYATAAAVPCSVARATQHHGKALSYINLLDADAALAATAEFDAPAACVVKHATPCGLAEHDDLGTAIDRAFAGDPIAAFGGILAVNRRIDRAAAERVVAFDKLMEVVVAPGFDADALDLLRARWKNCRLLEVTGPITPATRDRALAADARTFGPFAAHRVAGGLLVQRPDPAGLAGVEFTPVSKRPPTADELRDLRFAYLACKPVKSNAVVLARGGALVGVGGGQVDRVTAARLAAEKAGARARGAVAASDAFFPFDDGPRLLLAAGVTALVHPGGSVRDADTVRAADDAGAAVVVTGCRQFRH